MLGYPVEAPFDGTALRRCAGPAAPVGSDTGLVSVTCAMTGGASGGPWLTGFARGAGARQTRFHPAGGFRTAPGGAWLIRTRGPDRQGASSSYISVDQTAD